MQSLSCFFFFNDPATPEIYTLSLHDALPISAHSLWRSTRTTAVATKPKTTVSQPMLRSVCRPIEPPARSRSEEHTSELQSRLHLVCRLLLEKKKNKRYKQRNTQHH